MEILHIDIPRPLSDVFRRKYPENIRTNSWFLLHDNAPAHRPVLVKDFLAKNNVTTLEHPPYSPDLAAVGICLFPWLKSTLKGRRFGDTTDNIKNATEELKRLSTKASRNVSNTFNVAYRSVWVQEGLFRRKCSLNDGTIFVFLRNNVILGIFWIYTYILVIRHTGDDHGSDGNMLVKNINMCSYIFIIVHFIIYVYNIFVGSVAQSV